MRQNFLFCSVVFSGLVFILTCLDSIPASAVPVLEAHSKQKQISSQATSQKTKLATRRRPKTVVSPAQVTRHQISAPQPTTVLSEKAAKPPAPLPSFAKQISAKSFMVLDSKTGDILYTRKPDSPHQPASTIKILTALIALKTLEPQDIIPISRWAADMPSSKVYLDIKQAYLANDLINAVLLSSANDASVALAEKISGSEPHFTLLMNFIAKMWGAKDTVCKTASGLTAKGQHTTVRDLAHLFRFAMQHEDFSKRMAERRITTSYGKTLYNHNKALWRIDGAVGGKTGYTLAARQTYVGQFSRDGQTIIVAILGSESMWADLKNLVNNGFKKLEHDRLAGGKNTPSFQMAQQ